MLYSRAIAKFVKTGNKGCLKTKRGGLFEVFREVFKAGKLTLISYVFTGLRPTDTWFVLPYSWW